MTYAFLSTTKTRHYFRINDISFVISILQNTEMSIDARSETKTINEAYYPQCVLSNEIEFCLVLEP